MGDAPTDRSGGARPAAAALTQVARVAALAAATIALTVLAGRLLDVEALTSWGAAKSGTAGTAVAVVLLALACVASPRRSVVARVAAGLAALAPMTALLLYLSGTAGEPGADQMSLPTALCLLTLAVVATTRGHHRRVEEVAAAGVAVVAATALLGYLYDLDPLYAIGPGSSIMGLPVAVCLVLLAVATLAAVPHGTATWLVHGRDAGAVLLRRLLPVLLVVPVTGYLVILGEREGWYGAGLATAMTIGASVLLLGGATAYTARVLARTDERRERALTALTWVNADLAERIQARAEELESERSRAEVLADRQRIAADMHDHVIQGLYAVALDLNAVARRDGDPDGPGSEATRRAVHGIDEAIKELRASIFELKHPATSGNLAVRLEKLVRNAGHTLAVSFSNQASLDLVDDLTAEQLVAAAREALSNAVRHSGAGSVTVQLTNDGETLVLVVSDDGRGLDPSTRSTSGMRNMRERAEMLGGTCVWGARAGGGTTVTWRVPSRAASTTGRTSTQVREPVSGLTTHLVESVAACARAMATSPRAAALDQVAGVVQRHLDADHVSVGVAAPDDQMRLVLATGMPPDIDAVGLLAPREATLSGYVMATGSPLKVDDLASLPTSLRLFGRLPFGAALMVPVGDPAFATLVLARTTGRAPFTRRQLDDAATLTALVALALDLAGEVPDAEVYARGMARHDPPAVPPTLLPAQGRPGEPLTPAGEQ